MTAVRLPAAGGAGVAPARRLVEHDQARVGEQEPGDRQQLALAGRQVGVAVEQLIEPAGKRGEPGAEAHVVADAVASRAPEDRAVGLEKMAAASAVLTSTETALFELLRAAGTPEFKAVQGLVK